MGCSDPGNQVAAFQGNSMADWDFLVYDIRILGDLPKLYNNGYIYIT